MSHKGLIIKIEQSYLIVLTDANEYFRINKKNDCVVGQKIFFTDEDIQNIHTQRKESFYMNKKIIGIVAALLLLLSVGGYLTFVGVPGNALDSTIATVLTVDINPSVKLSLNADNKVVEVKALNKDAETLNFDGILGLTAEVAVEKIVALAKAGGFIDTTDLVDDYVLITAVDMTGKNDNNVAKVETQIQEKIASSEELQDVNVAMIKATKVDMLEAMDKKVPVGLYVVNGQITIDDKPMSVKSYFSNSDRVDDFKDKGVVIDKKLDKKIELANKFIEKLDGAGVDTTAYKAALAATPLDIDSLLTQIKTAWEAVEVQNDDKDASGEDKDEDKDITTDITTDNTTDITTNATTDEKAVYESDKPTDASDKDVNKEHENDQNKDKDTTDKSDESPNKGNGNGHKNQKDDVTSEDKVKEND